MTSSEAYVIAENLKEMIPKLEEAKSKFQIAKAAVNQNQLGIIPDTISDSLDKLILYLRVVNTNFELYFLKLRYI